MFLGSNSTVPKNKGCHPVNTLNSDSPFSSPSRLARLAGLAYLLIIACGLFAEFAVRQALVIPGDAAATAASILAREGLFRAGFVADIFMLLGDLVVGWAMYVLLLPVSRDLSRLALLLRVTHTAVLGANLVHHIRALELARSGQDQLAVLALGDHGDGYLVAQVFFGFHVLLLAWLLWRWDGFPRLLAGLLAVGGAGYLVESFVLFLYPAGAAVTVPGIAAAGIAEILFCGWLLLNRLGPRPQRNQ